MIVLLRSTDGNPDSRFQKYTDFLEKSKIDYYTLCWDRLGTKDETEKNSYYKKIAKYGDGVGNIFNLFLFNWFIITNLIKNRSRYKIIHACDLDTIIPAIFMKLFFRKKVIYDIFDWYIDSRNVTNSILKWIFVVVEFFNIHCSDIVIVCEEERIKQIYFKAKKIWILPNIPYFENLTFEDFKKDKLTLSYVGILGEYRGLEKVIEYGKSHPSVNLNIAGFGPLEKLLVDLSKYPNIKYWGTVPYIEGLKIMNNSDIICAIYEKTNVNHIYAAPNKYYEGLFLSKPIITTKKTLVGDKTEKNGTGYVIEESYAELCNVLDTINDADLVKFGMNAKSLWKDKYQNYIPKFMNDVYLAYIHSVR